MWCHIGSLVVLFSNEDFFWWQFLVSIDTLQLPVNKRRAIFSSLNIYQTLYFVFPPFFFVDGSINTVLPFFFFFRREDWTECAWLTRMCAHTHTLLPLEGRWNKSTPTDASKESYDESSRASHPECGFSAPRDSRCCCRSYKTHKELFLFCFSVCIA